MNVYCPKCKKKLVDLTPHLTRNHSYWCDECDLEIEITEQDKKRIITRKIKAGEKYRHFKGNIYEVIAVATHTETLDKLVIYKRVDCEGVFAKPYEMFISKVDEDKYPDATQRYRFEKVTE